MVQKKEKKGIVIFYCAGYMTTLKTQNFLNGQTKRLKAYRSPTGKSYGTAARIWKLGRVA